MIIDGKNIANQIRLNLKQFVLKNDIQDKIGLAVVLVGQDPASHIYVNNKVRACTQIGIRSMVYKLPDNISQVELVQLVDSLNQDRIIDGILLQLPLPSHIDAQKVIDHIDSKKDVDGLSKNNVYNLQKGYDCLKPCTPLGIMKLIASTGVVVEGKHAVVVGRSEIVGKPMVQLLNLSNATVTNCHSLTSNLAQLTSLADILIVAVGQRHLIGVKHVKKGAIVIDVGINRLDNKLYGDVDFEQVKDIASYITPVPGGVGPMTIAMLMSNVIKAAGYDIKTML
ncbi:MAG: bifunctional 5,10-methylenetetrahydrofolate dehydrogenase/5,10-methenyltetrahydrofolate cyclohydrolase [Firmicutes bacterium]|nr:bifunctional 5,10-methylenetetrahydrofolate dehydrogenase/5,10-methenyltetrahydrofolate cyclohydrolase [Bacillota bacterium]